MEGGEGELGVMLYGYGRSHAEDIGRMLDGLLKREVAVISGSGRERDPVIDVVNGVPPAGREPAYVDGETRVLMFLGFDDEQIAAVLDAFPRDGSIPRPIFCTLTESNAGWPLSGLIEHLLEEKRAWAARRR